MNSSAQTFSGDAPLSPIDEWIRKLSEEEMPVFAQTVGEINKILGKEEYSSLALARVVLHLGQLALQLFADLLDGVYPKTLFGAKCLQGALGIHERRAANTGGKELACAGAALVNFLPKQLVA